MFYTISADLIFYQFVRFTKRYSNSELKLYNYFYSKTEGISPELVVTINQFILFFVKNENYFDSKPFLDSMRREVKGKKILIIRAEKILINLLFSLFPDLYIHNVALEVDDSSGRREISLYFLSYKERGIAIGRKAEYIKCVNILFAKYIKFENNCKPIEVKCKNLIPQAC